MKLALALCLLISMTLVAAAQEPPTAPPADAGLIQLSVWVTDPSGRLVTGFEKEAFQLWEDDMEQKIVSMSLGKDLNEYVLSYKPTNSANDGSFRKLKVGFSPQAAIFRGLVLRTKDGYVAPTTDKRP